MKKIAVFLSTSGHSGVDRVAHNLIPELCSLGYSVDLLKVRNHGPYLEFSHANYHLVDLGSKSTYGCLPKLVQYLNNVNPDVVFSDKDRVNRTILLAKFLSSSSTRLYFSIGTTVSIDLKGRRWLDRTTQRLSIRYLYQYAEKVLVGSVGVKEDLAEYTGLSSMHIQVTPRPVVNSSLFNNQQPLPEHPWFRQKNVKVIIGVGELSARKNWATTILAFNEVRKHYSAKLVLIGKGRELDNLQSLVKNLGLTDDVYFTGFVNNPYPYIQHADVLAFSSLWEGLGFVLIEALALGTPVVSSDCPSGPKEILANGKYGYLYEPRDHIQMSKCLLSALADHPDKKYLQEGARPYEVSASAKAYLTTFGLI